ncbi:AI-2E family transporter [Roseibacterium sp. SDUM158017]|uniref:AI-2E family transporter n=1 Tax=Roseicyclus salinarum TaxID=3036773 RepID=UPI0024153804|nr:AI-2E family transporter [Roseibacterium sp. SDUM158017]MDG4647809.1 AI-2E family transporter [Roseibacterium sp. SDUM158017]
MDTQPETHLMNHRAAQTLFLGLLALIAVFAALRVGQGLFAPVVAALVLGVVCAPPTDAIERIGLPRTVSALLVLGGFAVFASTLFVLIEPTVTRAIRNAPSIWREVTDMLEAFRATLAGVEELQQTVEGALGGAQDGASGGPQDSPVQVPGLMDALALAPSFAAQLLIFAGTFYFFLVGRRDIYERTDRGPTWISSGMLFRAERRVSRYFLTITLINATFGVLIGGVMTLIGLPQPMLWGMAAFLINFVLYLGPAVLAVALAAAGILTFDGPMSFVPALAYLALNMTEGQFVTPSLVGRNMHVNPLLVFVSLVVWLWLWGPVGGVVAIPVLVWSLYVLGHLDRDARDGAGPAGGRRAAPGAGT